MSRPDAKITCARTRLGPEYWADLSPYDETDPDIDCDADRSEDEDLRALGHPLAARPGS